MIARVVPLSTLAMVASTATITLVLVVVLLLLGAAMIALAVWLIRMTRSDPVSLGPLEVMGDRAWRRGDADRRTARLTKARPPGSPPPAPMVPIDGDEPDPDSEPEAEDTADDPADDGGPATAPA